MGDNEPAASRRLACVAEAQAEHMAVASLRATADASLCQQQPQRHQRQHSGRPPLSSQSLTAWRSAVLGDGASPAAGARRGAGPRAQLRLLCARQMRHTVRHPMLLWLQLVITAVISVAAGLVFHQVSAADCERHAERHAECHTDTATPSATDPALDRIGLPPARLLTGQGRAATRGPRLLHRPLLPSHLARAAAALAAGAPPLLPGAISPASAHDPMISHDLL